MHRRQTPGSWGRLRDLQVRSLEDGTDLRSESFRLRVLHGSSAGTPLVLEDTVETLLLTPFTGARLRQAGVGVDAPRRCVSVLPPGPVEIELAADGLVLALAPAADSAARQDPPCQLRERRSGIRVHPVDDAPTMPHNPRIRLFQSAVMSLNWTEYSGPRDRSTLSPHLHESFAQGALSLVGRFTHHLRLPWGSDARQWEADRHIYVRPGAFVEIPPGVIHTTEGTGDGPHLLIEMFCPVRADFRARGWISNSADYVDV